MALSTLPGSPHSLNLRCHLTGDKRDQEAEGKGGRWRSRRRPPLICFHLTQRRGLLNENGMAPSSATSSPTFAFPASLPSCPEPVSAASTPLCFTYAFPFANPTVFPFGRMVNSNSSFRMRPGDHCPCRPSRCLSSFPSSGPHV